MLLLSFAISVFSLPVDSDWPDQPPPRVVIDNSQYRVVSIESLGLVCFGCSDEPITITNSEVISPGDNPRVVSQQNTNVILKVNSGLTYRLNLSEGVLYKAKK